MSFAIGIDVGGTYIKYGLADHMGSILYESTKPTYLLGKQVYDNISNIIVELKTYTAAKGLTLEGIGIGVPAIIDKGQVNGCQANLPELEGMALGSLLEAWAGMLVSVDNDASLMGLAEWKFGAARGATDAIFLTIGTGIGGAMVVNGELYAGYRNRGAELGHIIVQADGYPCGCGGNGCLEAHASVKALIREYTIYLHEQEKIHTAAKAEITGSVIISRYLEGQPAAVRAMNRHFDYLGAGIAGLINIFSPQKLIIGGGISEAGEVYIQQIRQRAMSRAMKETSLNTDIVGAQLGNRAGLLGAAALVFNRIGSSPY